MGLNVRFPVTCSYDDFIKHYDSEVVEKLIKEIQDKIIKERGNMDIDKQA